MRIVYYTSGVTGSGRLVLGITINNALLRRGICADFVIVHSAPDTRILGQTPNFKLPMESAAQTDAGHFENSAVFKLLSSLSPDVLIVDLLWIPVHHLLSALACKKIFLTRQVADSFFSYSFQGVSLAFDPNRYDKVLAIEPYPCPVTRDHIEPLVIRNKSEILSRDQALERLGLDPEQKHCLYSLNVKAEEASEIEKAYSSLKDEGYRFYYSSLFAGGSFPIVDCFNAFDFIVCGAGYNAFWETIYFGKIAEYRAMPKRFENQQWRVEHCRAYQFRNNGADELVEIIIDLCS
ncbi:MAG: hypothetical protein JXD23_03980 [Spirochaetales bacterium]|nr:hypothetical protein [Spirochaetales bacterium]